MKWSRREFLTAARRALTVACAVMLVPSAADIIVRGPKVAAPLPVRMPRKFQIRADVCVRPDLNFAYQVRWAFNWKGRSYDWAQLYARVDFPAKASDRQIAQILIQRTAPVFEAAMRRRMAA